MDAIELLEKQHREVESFFRELKLLDRNEPKSRQAIFEMIADSLAVHAQIEERIFYPAAKSRKTDTLLHHSVEEHLQVKRVIARLMAMDLADPQFEPLLAELERDVTHHVRDEETQLLPYARLQLGRMKLDELGAQMERMVADLEQHQPREAVPGETDHPAPI
jgi:hypothetical protein